MLFTVSHESVLNVCAQALVVGVYAAAQDETQVVAARLGPAAAAVDAASAGLITRVLESEEFTGELGQVHVLFDVAGVAAGRVILVGLGQAGTLTEARLVRALEALARHTRAKSLALDAQDWLVAGRDAAWAVRTAARVLTFAPAKTEKVDAKKRASHAFESIVWVGQAQVALQAAAHEGMTLGEAMLWARSLADLPPNRCTPRDLAKAARALEAVCKDTKPKRKLSCKVYEGKDLTQERMGGLLAVSKGSAEPAVMIELTYKGAAKTQAPIVLVGKGITFDAGGISLKPARGMDAMKFDMCGASIALAAVKFAFDMQLPINVTALVPACENLPSGTATKPADVITMADGTTVEVLNTDAEGRMILADALIRAQALKPAACVDMATLTGACIAALGNHYTGLFCENAEFACELEQAAASAVDPVWALPMGEVFADTLKSPVADLANIANVAYAGASTAATFLAHFAPKSCPWAHLDIAGTANTSQGNKHSLARPLPLVCQWLLARAQSADVAKAAKKRSSRKKSQ